VNKNIKLLVADIDGTLIPDDPHILSEYTKDVLTKLKNKGVKIGIASGRNCIQLLDMQKLWDFEFDMLIGLNGGELYDSNTKETYKTKCLTKKARKEILETIMPKFPWLNPTTYASGKRYMLRESNIKVPNHNILLNTVIVKDISELWHTEDSKLMFRIDEDKIEEVYEFAKTLPQDDYYVTLTQTTMMEFNHKEAKKAKALIRYCDKYNIDLKDVVAFGDMINDNDMLEVSGTGVALLNAGKSTKEVSDYVTDLDNNHDGLADFVSKYYL